MAVHLAADLKAAIDRASLPLRPSRHGPSPIPPRAAQPQTVAEARAVSVAYAGRSVVAGVSLALRRGEIYVLLGPNGSGKTTLLQALCGQVPSFAGTVAVTGADPRRCAAARRSIGLVPQDIALYPNLTTRENLEYFGRLAGLPRQGVRGRADHVMAECRLSDVAERQVRTLSGGFQRRTNLAAALIGRPALLLLDEPTVGLDRDAAAAIGEVLKAQRADGVAVLLISHDLDQAAALADRVGIMVAGRLLCDETLADLVGPEQSDREVVVVLDGEPSRSQRAVLASLDLTAREEPLVWAASGVERSGSIDRVAAVLDANRLAVREISLSRRGLAAVYERTIRGGGTAG